MIRPQRVIHRFVWLLLPPALLLALFYFSAPDTDLSPPDNANAPAALRAIGKGPLN
ncbi:MAG: hypothetical protein MPJ81_06480 [Gammaproteobacteria bacterium]|nr:hypothetical protein [Gammaproteobacteria bacterium]MDA8007827.1 hypothetical protein [Gammaproteobacteria bacterium]